MWHTLKLLERTVYRRLREEVDINIQELSCMKEVGTTDDILTVE